MQMMQTQNCFIGMRCQEREDFDADNRITDTQQR